MPPVNLTHLIYASTATSAFVPSDLQSILLTARANNAARLISGMLLYTSGSFFQVLEGDGDAIEALYAGIAADRRHANVTRIICEPIAERVFGDWSMGYISPENASELESIEGLSDLFGQGSSLVDLRPGRAKKLLSAFSQGRWRARIAGRGI